MSNNQQNTGGLFFLGLFLAIGLIISAVLVTASLKDIKKSDQDIMVKGYAERNITSDLGVWSCNIRARAFDMVTAYDKLKNDIQKTKKYILSKGIKEGNMSIESVNTMKIMKMNDEGRYTNQIIGYELEQKITVSSNDVKLIQFLANESTSLIQDGIEIYSYSPQFFYTKLNDLKIEMLGKATKDAKVRAEQLAKNSDSEVGQLKSARQGVFQITPVNSVDVSDYGEYDLTTIGKTIKAVVTVEFSIE
ncbi:SIMPL domain-containing protein [Bacteroidota bacterium]